MKKRVAIYFLTLISSVFLMNTLLFAMPKSGSLMECLIQQSEENQVSIEQLEYVTCNNLNSLEGIEKLKKVKYLEIAESQLSEIPSTFTTLKTLRTLNLTNNQFREIPRAVFSLKNLEELIITNNKIEYVASDIATLKNLRMLNLSGNKITDLGDGVSELVELEYLSLSTNRLISLPNLERLTKLRSLDINNNQIGLLPDFTKNPLEYFNANSNMLEENVIQAKDREFAIEQSFSLKTVSRGTIIEVDEKWSTFSDDLFQLVVFSNGVKPYGFSNYQLFNVKNELGDAVQFSDFFDINTKNVLKNGSLIAQIGITASESKTVFYSKDTIKIILQTTTKNIDTPDKSGKIDEITDGNDEEDSVLDSADINGGGENSGQQGNVMIIPPIKEKMMPEFDWYNFFMKAQEDSSTSWWTYFIGRFFLLRMTLAVLALLPIVFFVVIIVRANKIYQKTVETIYRRSEERE